jgi:peptidoglycan/xylan/chitin deacetylase (PgdA/CDA1 family)
LRLHFSQIGTWVEGAVRVLIIVVAALATLGLAAFGVVAAQKAVQPGHAVVAALAAKPAAAVPAKPAAAVPASPVSEKPAQPVQVAAQAPVAAPPAAAPAAAPAAVAAAEPIRLAQNTAAPNSAAAPGAALASATPHGSGGTNSAAACDKPDAMGLARIVEIDTKGGPAFGFEHFKQYDFLREHEVVLTFDDGPWPENTPAVLKALTDQCLKATFFEIGEHATWHPEISKMVAAAGMTIGSHTWSHKDLARNPYASDIEQAKQEIEMGVSAVHAAVDGPIAPFFRFPDLQQPPVLLSYLGERNIATFSTDIDSFDFKIRRPEQVIKSVMSKLEKRGKGIVLVHDFQHATAEAMPELLRQLKAAGFKVVHMVPKAPVTTVAKYDDMLRTQDKLSVNNTRPENSVVRTISGN